MKKTQQTNRRRHVPLWKRAVLVILCTALCAAAAWGYSTFLATPAYQCAAKLEIHGAFLPEDYYGQTGTRDLNEVFTGILTDKALLESVGNECGVSGDALRKRVKTAVLYATPPTLSLAVTAASPEEAKKLSDAYLAAVDAAVRASVPDMDWAENKLTPGALPTRPVSPNVLLNTILAALIGFVVSFAVFSGQPLFDTCLVLLFGLFTLLCIFPFYYLFINTISDNKLVSAGLINFVPRGVHFTNYYNLRDVSDLGSSVVVTVARTILGTALMVITSAWAGYLVTKRSMWRRSLWYRMLVVTMYFNAGLIPWYTNMLMLGLTDNFLAYIIPGMIAPYNIILVKTYIESIPASLEESAVIDGAGTTTVFVKIILPLSVPILATISIFGAVGNWNSFQDSLLLMTSRPDLYTLQHRLYTYLNQATNLGAIMSSSSGATAQNVENMLSSKVIKYTISMVTIIPILCVYPFMQRFFVKGIMLGAVKG